MNLSDLQIIDQSDPDFVYGRSASRNAQPFAGLVVHHTADKPIQNLVNYGKSIDRVRGGAFGYHYYVGKDGQIIQGAPLDKRTNHIKPPKHSQRKGSVGLSNANAIGITLIGAERGATPAQRKAAEQLGRALMAEYNIGADSIFGHGDLQRDRQATEGAEIVGLLRGGAGNDTLTGQGEEPKGSYFSDRLSRHRKTDGKSTAPTAPEAGGYFSQRLARQRKLDAPEEAPKPEASTPKGGEGFFGEPTTGGDQSFLGGVLDSFTGGLTFGFGDEITALEKAIVFGTDSEGFWEEYDRFLAAERGQNKGFAQERPITDGVAKVGGAVAGVMAAPGSVLARIPAAATVPGKVGMAAAGGATAGAVAGFGEGEGGAAGRGEARRRRGRRHGDGGGYRHEKGRGEGRGEEG